MDEKIVMEAELQVTWMIEASSGEIGYVSREGKSVLSRITELSLNFFQ